MAAYRTTQFNLKAAFVLTTIIALALAAYRLLDFRQVAESLAALVLLFLGYGWYWVITRMPQAKNPVSN